MGITPGMIAGGLSLAGGLSGLFGGGGAGSVQLPPMQPINTSGIQGQLNSNIPQLNQYNMGGQNYGQYADILQSTVNNPYGGQAVGGAQYFGGAGANNAANAYGNAGAWGSTVPTSIAAGNQILNTAFDPQNALFKQQQDLQSQQTLAGLAGSGLATTPWGQGVYGQNMGNFDINWQNAQLGREATGIQGAEAAYGGAGAAATGAYGLGQSATQGGAADTALPFNTQNMINQNALSSLSGGAAYGQASAAVPQTGIGDWLQYLSGANSANSVANTTGSLGLQQQQQQFQQNQIYGLETGAGLYGLAGGFGGGSPFGGGYGGNIFSGMPSYGGGSPFGGDAWGGSASQPLPGLDASDYG